VVLALENGALTFPRVPLLLTELRYYQYHLTAASNVKLGAPARSGATDDLVTALALAVRAAGKEPAFLEALRRQVAALSGTAPPGCRAGSRT
jgi:hypothetical protein